MFLLRSLLWLFVCIVVVAANVVRCPPKKNCPELVDAAVKGNISRVKELLLLKTCDVDSVADDNRTALHRAVSLGRPGMVFVLLDRGANPHVAGPGGFTTLHAAANSTHAVDAMETVAHLLLRDVNRLTRDDRGRLPLHLAARRGHLSAARLLLTACAPACRLSQLQSRDVGMTTPKEYARAYGHRRTASWLQTVVREAAEMKMTLSPPNKRYCTDLAKEHHNLMRLRNSLRNCYVDSVNKYQQTALMLAMAKNIDATFILLTHGADVNRLNVWSDNSLRYISPTGESTGLALLHKANRFQTSGAGDMPLHGAGYHSHMTVSRLLLSNCDTTCKLRQLRWVSRKHQKTPSQCTSDSTIRAWLNQVRAEAAEERVMEARRGLRPQCGVDPEVRDQFKLEMQLKMDNINQTLHGFMANVKTLLHVIIKIVLPETANKTTIIAPHTVV